MRRASAAAAGGSRGGYAAQVPLFSRDTKVEALRSAPLFAGLSRKELAELAKVTEDVDVDTGKVLCKEGQTGQEFFVIMEGEWTSRAAARGSQPADAASSSARSPSSRMFHGPQP